MGCCGCDCCDVLCTQELYSQAYYKIGVTFTSIPNFSVCVVVVVFYVCVVMVVIVVMFSVWVVVVVIVVMFYAHRSCTARRTIRSALRSRLSPTSPSSTWLLMETTRVWTVYGCSTTSSPTSMR